jgi:hypothetical protein
MKVRTPALMIPTAPRLFDVLALEMRADLKTAFSWLNEVYLHAFSKVEDNGDFAPYAQGVKGNYIKLLPDAAIGNFAFFETQGSQPLDFARSGSEFETVFSMVVFFDYRTVYPADHLTRSVENVKYDLLSFFEGQGFSSGSVEVTAITSDKDEVYRGYNVRDLINVFLVRPYGAVRLDMVGRYNSVNFC